MKTKSHQTKTSELQNRNEQLGTKTEDKTVVPANPGQSDKTQTENIMNTAKAVFFDGPEPEQDREGEEIPVWHVYVGDEHAEPLSRVYRVFSFKKAEALAQAMAKDRQLNLIADAIQA
jgi:hypothetical protein